MERLDGGEELLEGVLRLGRVGAVSHWLWAFVTPETTVYAIGLRHLPWSRVRRAAAFRRSGDWPREVGRRREGGGSLARSGVRCCDSSRNRHSTSSRPDRRDRLLLISALAIAVLSLLGAAGERIGYDRWLKANTVTRRTHSGNLEPLRGVCNRARRKGLRAARVCQLREQLDLRPTYDFARTTTKPVFERAVETPSPVPAHVPGTGQRGGERSLP